MTNLQLIADLRARLEQLEKDMPGVRFERTRAEIDRLELQALETTYAAPSA
jgi:hypothetical protein